MRRMNADVLAVRGEFKAQRRVHGRFLTDAQISAVFKVVGNAGVCADALVMHPRPSWVEALAGPFPASLELADPNDVASIAEWGSFGEGT